MNNHNNNKIFDLDFMSMYNHKMYHDPISLKIRKPLLVNSLPTVFHKYIEEKNYSDMIKKFLDVEIDLISKFEEDEIDEKEKRATK